MKKSINAWTIPDEFSFEEAFKCAAAAGFDGIELNVDAADRSAHSLTLDVNADVVKSIKGFSEKYNIAVSGISTSLWGKNPIGAVEPELIEAGYKLLNCQIEYARAFGCDGILIVPGGVSDTVSIQTAWNSALNTFVKWRDCIESCGVKVGVENVWNNFFISPLDMVRFLDELSIRNLGAYFDVGNVAIFTRPEHWIEILGGRIQKIHVKDFLKTGTNAGWFVNLLEGSINWAAVIKALRNAGYDGYLTAELSAMPQSNDYMMMITERALDHIISL